MFPMIKGAVFRFKTRCPTAWKVQTTNASFARVAFDWTRIISVSPACPIAEFAFQRTPAYLVTRDGPSSMTSAYPAHLPARLAKPQLTTASPALPFTLWTLPVMSASPARFQGVRPACKQRSVIRASLALPRQKLRESHTALSAASATASFAKRMMFATPARPILSPIFQDPSASLAKLPTVSFVHLLTSARIALPAFPSKGMRAFTVTSQIATLALNIKFAAPVKSIIGLQMPQFLPVSSAKSVTASSAPRMANARAAYTTSAST